MDHEEARRKHVGGKILGLFFRRDIPPRERELLPPSRASLEMKVSLMRLYNSRLSVTSFKTPSKTDIKMRHHLFDCLQLEKKNHHLGVLIEKLKLRKKKDLFNIFHRFLF